MKTEQQINDEIAALKLIKPQVREYTAFGDSNHEAIDAQIEVLEKRMSGDDVHDSYQPDETNEDDERSESVFFAALEAHDWMRGTSDDEPPSDGWRSAVKK